MDENELLNEILSRQPGSRVNSQTLEGNSLPSVSPNSNQQDLDLCQWQVNPNGVFRPAAKTIMKLEAGAYGVGFDDHGIFIRSKSLMSDDIVELPDAANMRVLSSIQKFWNSQPRYKKHGLIFKRGVLLWGPPGSGKTVTIHLLARDLIARGGIILFCEDPKLLSSMLVSVRKIEQDRPLIVVFEDIDETIKAFGEHVILSMLDGENQTNNVVYVATTNYPELLGARIVNRPSRFDERIYVGMPSEQARVAYLASVNAQGLSGIDVEKWAGDTAGLSIAHLRELVAAVCCLDQEYEEVLKRLKAMSERPKDVDGFSQRAPGFGGLNAGSTRR